MNRLDRAVAALVPHLPRQLVGLVARRYVAGEELDDALSTCEQLNADGMTTTMDVLGEDIHEFADATATVDEYRRVLDAIRGRGIDGNISVKLSHLGLRLDRERCFENVRTLVEQASSLDNFVRIDMENSTTTDDTLAIYRRLRETHSNVGVVLQSRMKRSLADAEALTSLRTRVRVCKGIYREPATIAHQADDAIRASFLEIVEHLLRAGCHVGIATHDRRLVESSMSLIERLGGCSGIYEFQMLLGVTEALRREILQAGHPLRVYVPYGREWYAYSIRRLRENPQIAGHVFRAMLRLG